MTRERAEELLAEKGMNLEWDPSTGRWYVYRPSATHAGERALVAFGKLWREAVSIALGEPAY